MKNLTKITLVLSILVCSGAVFGVELHVPSEYPTIQAATDEAIDSNETCEFEWKPGQGLDGIYGTIFALTRWDPDGNGPQKELLIAGGYLIIAGEEFVNNVAAWDGNSWQSLGSGMGGAYPYVFALTIYNGELIAGGDFATAGGISANHIARWDGSSWQPLGSGVNSNVWALTVYNGELIAGGDFTTDGGVSANRIARWDGNSWHPLDSGINGRVGALTVYNGELIAGGSFTTGGGGPAKNIARWDGSLWHPLGSGVNNAVWALTVYNGELIAGGWFTTAGGVTANKIARWDGSSWLPLNSGMNGSVGALTVYNGELIAGGGFTNAGGVDANYIARWDGSTWKTLGVGMSGGLVLNETFVYTLISYNGELVAGGYFDKAGGVPVNNIARWNGSSWKPFERGMNSNVYGLTVYNDELIAGGDFTIAGGVSANKIARWDGSSWQSLGSGMSGGRWSMVFVLTVYNGELIAGGNFTTAGGVAASNIARWDGSSWHPLGSGMTGGEDYTYVYALTVYNGELIAGGWFTTAGNVNSQGIARWDGSSWHQLCGGMNYPVWALTVYNGELIVGGGFTTVGGISANNIACWDSSSWQPLGSGMDGGNFSGVYALTVYNGELITGGWFTTAGGDDANSIASWDGNSWHPLGSGIGVWEWDPHMVLALMVYEDELIAGGDFTTAGGRVSAYWARWGPVNQPPVACLEGGDRIVEAGSNCEARVILDGSCSSDEDSTEGTNDDIVSLEWYEQIDPCDANSDILLGTGEVIECNLPLGEHNIVLEVTDEAGESDSNEITVTVKDVTPPVLSLTVTPNVLWPANNKMVRIEPLWETSDNCDDNVDVSLAGITVDGGDYRPDDIRIAADGTIELRAERSGKGNGPSTPSTMLGTGPLRAGRIYTITYQVTDDSNNVTVDSATVTVPHDRR
jgi:hypothetical protein